MQALVIGDSVELILPLPAMLQEAGFDVDCVSTRRQLKKMPVLRHFFHVAQLAHLPTKAASLAGNHCELVIVADDISLHTILKSSLAAEDKVALLPVIALENFSHLCSKIGLSRPLQTVNNRKIAPSKLRDYLQTGTLDISILEDLHSLGLALGAHGLVNISLLIADTDKKRYFIEADMRPTTWIDFLRFFGDGPAQKIKNYFSFGLTCEALVKRDHAYPGRIILPYFLRMELWELAIDRYQVWRYMQHHRMSAYALLRKTKLSLLAVLNMHALRKTFKKYF